MGHYDFCERQPCESPDDEAGRKLLAILDVMRKEYAETHDGNAAFEKHVGSIGDEKLRKAAKTYVERKIKPVKPKQ